MTDSAEASGKRAVRLQSIDALRGFDMFWIIGGDTFAKSLLLWLGYSQLADQFEHVKWNGFRFYDLIFPLFLFLVGVVLPFSLAKYLGGALGKTDYRGVYLRIVRRTILLLFLGLVVNGLLQLNFEKFRWVGVLQRIGICYFFVALAVLHLSRVRQIILFALLLIGYWCLLLWVPAPGFKPYDLTMEGSLPGYVDRLLLPGRLYYKLGDNEGILSTIPAIATTLLGAFAGYWLQSSRTPITKVSGLYGAAVGCLVIGYAWSFTFPLNKILWTSSFVLVTGGCSLALLATFYALIDVMNFRRWSFFFVVIGVNAITIYVAERFVDFTAMSKFFLGGVNRYFGLACANVWEPNQVQAAQTALMALGELTLEWLFLWYLYRKKTFLRL